MRSPMFYAPRTLWDDLFGISSCIAAWDPWQNGDVANHGALRAYGAQEVSAYVDRKADVQPEKQR